MWRIGFFRIHNVWASGILGYFKFVSYTVDIDNF